MTAIAEEFPESTALMLTLADEEDVAAVVLVPSQFALLKYEAERAVGRTLRPHETFSVGGVQIRKGVVH